MASPASDIYQMQVRNPHASLPLIIPVHVLCNTPDEDLEANIRENSFRGELPWIAFRDANRTRAILVGGGPSLADHIGEIKKQARDCVVFAMNGASQFLRANGVFPDYQVIADAKPETATLVDPKAGWHLVASQADPATLDACGDTVSLWHLGIEDMERLFPGERVKAGGYALVGGGAAVGNSALCLAYVMGYREMHCYGYDSSHRGEESHAYRQPMNQFIPTVDVEWGGEVYTSSVAMKAQAEKFQITAQRLKQEGCEVVVHGDGLLPAMFNTPPENLTERDKYRHMWRMDGYRETSPGLWSVEKFLNIARPEGLVVDFGCGTGKAMLALDAAGLDVIGVDFADNCRDEEAINLPFLEWDLTQPCPLAAKYGFCTDVMEHIPPGDVDKVIANIMASAEAVFFQISTVPDQFGVVLGQPLHLTVKSPDWWAERFKDYEISWRDHDESACRFMVRRRTLSERTNNG